MIGPAYVPGYVVELPQQLPGQLLALETQSDAFTIIRWEYEPF